MLVVPPVFDEVESSVVALSSPQPGAVIAAKRATRRSEERVELRTRVRPPDLAQSRPELARCGPLGQGALLVLQAGGHLIAQRRGV